jgi:serine/threonine protein phosphatase PrpC
MAFPNPAIFIDAFGRTDPGRVRTQNQDTFAVVDLSGPTQRQSLEGAVAPGGALLVVADGMGGVAGGEVASALAVEALVRSLSASGDGGCDALRRAVEAANLSVYDTAIQSGRVGMGATLVAVLVRGPLACVASIGDSRAYLVRGGGASQLTKDQSIVEALLSAGAITPEEAEASPYRHVVTHAVGAKPEVKVALLELPLHRGDVLLLCSDGLSNEVTPDEMSLAVAEGRSLDDACQRLVELANSRGGKDNVTVVLARFDGDGLPGSSAPEM